MSPSPNGPPSVQQQQQPSSSTVDGQPSSQQKAEVKSATSTAAAASVPNAWAKKLAFKPPQAPAATTGNATATNDSTPPVRLVSGAPPPAISQQAAALNFGTSNSEKSTTATTMSYAATLTGKKLQQQQQQQQQSQSQQQPKSTAPLVSGSVPKEIQQNISAGQAAPSQLSFGTLDQSKPPVPVQTLNNPKIAQPHPAAFKQFEEIQRTRSAPPQLSEQEQLQRRLQLQQQQQQQQQSSSNNKEEKRPSDTSPDKKSSRPPSASSGQTSTPLTLNPAASSFAPQQFVPAAGYPPQQPFGFAPPHAYFMRYPPAYGMYPPQGFLPPQGFAAPPTSFRPPPPPQAAQPPQQPTVPASDKPSGATAPVAADGSSAPVAVPVPAAGPAAPPAMVPLVPIPVLPVPNMPNGPSVAAGSKPPVAGGAPPAGPTPQPPAGIPVIPIPVAVPPTAQVPTAPVPNGVVVPSVPPAVVKPIVLPKRSKNIIVFKNPETGEAIKLPEKVEEPKKQSTEDDATVEAKDDAKPAAAAETKSPAKSDVKVEEKKAEEVPKVQTPVKSAPVVEKQTATPPKSVTKPAPAASTPPAKQTPPATSPERTPAKPAAAEPSLASIVASPPSVKKTPTPAAASPSAPATTTPAVTAAASSTKPVAAPVAPSSATPSEKKLVYTREFLLQFRDLCIDKPENLPSVEAIVGEEAAPSNQQRRLSRQSGPQRGGRHSDIGLPRQGSSRGSSSRHSSSGGGKYPPGMPTGGRQSLAPSRRSSGAPGGRGGRGSQQQEPPKEEVAPLVKSENRWVPGAKPDDNDPTAILVKSARSLLNKLTLEKFDAISKKMTLLEIKDQEMLHEFIATIFEKAVDEPKFAEMYARLCFTLATSLPNYPKEYIDELVAEQKVDAQNFEMRHQFRRSLLFKCQKEFQAKTEWSKIADDDIKFTDDMTDEQIAELAAEKNRRQKLKRRALGNIKFIGELFKLSLLTEKIMHHCLKDLLANVKDPEEEAVESVCDLMEIVGKKLDHPQARQIMDAYFERLKILENHDGLPSRVRFKVTDIIELRSRRWEERERQKMLNAGPMTIDEIHQKAEEQQRAEQRKLERMSRGGSSRGGDGRRESRDNRRGRGGEDGSRPTAILKRNMSERNGPAKDQSQKTDSRDVRKEKENASGKNTPKTLTPRSSSVDSRAEKESRSGSGSKNMFDALVPNEANDDLEEGEILSETSSGDFVMVDFEKQVMESKMFDDYFHKEFSRDFCTAAEDSQNEAMKVILVMRSYVKDEDMTSQTIMALEKLITDISPEAKKDSPTSKRRVEIFSGVFAQLFQSDLLSQEDFDSFMENQLINMSDMILDIPGLDAMLGNICAACILSKLMDLNFVKSCILKMAEEMGDFTPRMPTRPGMKGPNPPAVAEFFGTLLSAVQSMEGISILQEVWLAFLQQQEDIDSAITLEQVDASVVKFPWFGTDKEKLAAIPDSVIAEWLQKYELLSAIAPKLHLTYEMEKSIQGDNVTVESFKEYLEQNFDQNTRQEAVFIEALTSVLLKHVHRLRETGEEEQLFKGWLGGLLKDLIESSPESSRADHQLQVLFAAQHTGNTDPLKKNDDQYFRRLFEALYESDIVEEQIFLKWEEGNAQLETKGLTMARGAKEFLEWLKTAETES